MQITKRDRLTLLDRTLIGILLLLVVLLLGVQVAGANDGGERRSVHGGLMTTLWRPAGFVNRAGCRGI